MRDNNAMIKNLIDSSFTQLTNEIRQNFKNTFNTLKSTQDDDYLWNNLFNLVSLSGNMENLQDCISANIEYIKDEITVRIESIKIQFDELNDKLKMDLDQAKTDLLK